MNDNLRYNFENDNFLIYENVDLPKKVEMQLPLDDSPIDISDWAESVNPKTGEITAKNKITFDSAPETVPNGKYTINGALQQQEQQQSKHTYNGGETLSRIIDEVSNEPGFEELKNFNVKDIIMEQARRESRFTQKASNSSSTASGYFQFIDSTRKKFSSYSKEDFLNDPKEQVRAAYKHFKAIMNLPQVNELKRRGYNDKFITVLGWWLPDSMNKVLRRTGDYSFGGYSIKKAFDQYEKEKWQDYIQKKI